ncbi:exodeoxyribonuclease VII small subunit [Geopseudomonas aromaticivorans]
MSRDTYEANMQFIEQTLKRLERNEVSIDELETLSREFAAARQFCLDRLARIESVVQATLGTDGEPAGERR